MKVEIRGKNEPKVAFVERGIGQLQRIVADFQDSLHQYQPCGKSDLEEPRQSLSA
jgi:hypothetical protein